MPKNFLIGIGGSGARIAESAIFTCASGFGPEKLFLFLIDPDKGNGNLGRTTKLISKYLDCKKSFIPVNRVNGEKINLFNTDLQVPPDEKDRVWGIFNKTKMTLSEWIGFDGLNNEKQKDEQDLMSILFSKEELTTELDEGFRGHPSIGSVVMTELPGNVYPFKLLWDQLTDNTPYDVRTFLVGSVFGGTGAAGFPTLGHRNTLKFNSLASLKNDTANEESISKILLGGALILPYFKVVKTEGSSGMHVTSNDFPIATKAALEFYDTKESLAFDDVYFIGDPLSQPVGKFSVGSTSQENKPHYIEVVSTLAAFDFFAQPPLQKKDPKTIYFIAKRDSEEVNWSSFPYSRNEENITLIQDEFKRKITTMSIFCYVLVTYARSILAPENDNKNRDEFKQPWYENFNHKKDGDDILNLRTSKNKELLDKYIDFAEEFLDWVCKISDYENVELIDKTKLFDEKGNWRDPVNSSLIGEILKENSKKTGWTESRGELGFIQSLNAVNINDNIKKQTKSMLASNRLINLFYEASEKFAKNNYTIN